MLSLLIISDVAASVFTDDSKVFRNSSVQEIEKESRNISDNVDNSTITSTIGDEDNKTIDNKSIDVEPATITVYCYPSSYLDSNYPYQLYKTVWDAQILNICELNPKGTFEKEWTRICDDCDFSCLTGFEKDGHGYSINDYLINITIF
jgi:hypothetical protein